ncbi:MAG: FAD-dependent oxidoreductase [Maritimibacter sp.]|nr:FAD-dependent oxidoreductase [Maritimibacter sp.]
MVTMTRGQWAEAGSSLEFKTGNWRSTQRPVHVHSKAPCHATCPAGEDQQAWFALLQEHRVEDAWKSLVRANPLPGVTGRVCPHPCETACNRTGVDGALAIHNVERWLGDEAVRLGWDYPVEAPSKDAPTVAIVGAGPAGISAAYHCVRLGLKAEIFEALPEAGGLLRSAIPPTRLPRNALDAELNRVLDLPGITLNLRQRLGRDVTVDGLRAKYAAVLLSPGCEMPKPWSVKGAVPADLHEGLQLLRDFMDHGALPEAAKGDVIVHGGGNTAMDICRIMKRAGAKSVTLITASGLPGPDTAPDDLINVVPRELEEAQEEGIEIIDHATVSRLIMKGSRVTGVEIISLKKEPGKDGRKRRVEFEGTERVVSVDMVVPCVGEQVAPEGYEGLLNGAYFWPDNPWGRIADRVFALGDARGSRGTVAAAIGDGRLAAEAVAAELRGDDDPAADDRPTMELGGLNTAYYPGSARARVAKLAVSERTFEAEIEGPISRAEALAEAQRCLSCGNCLACDNCWTMCPDNAVIKTVEMATDGSHYVFDYEYCKGCGLCTHECPTGYIQSVPETA